MTTLELYDSLHAAYVILMKARIAAAGGPMPVWRKLTNACFYIDQQVQELLN